MTILISLALTLVVSALFRWSFGDRLPGLALVAVYFALCWIVDRVRNRKLAAERAAEPKPDFSHWPDSGPIGRLGQWGLAVPWFLTNMLSMLNPFQAVQLVKQIAGNAKLEAREKESGDDGRNYQTKAAYTLPFQGEWLVVNGGMTPRTSHSWDLLGQRFALDFVQADAAFSRHTGRGTRPEEYYCYGAEILAAADGTVAATEDRIGLAPLLGWGVCDFTARSFIGNHVMIQHAPGEYALYAHLIQGSVTVKPGDPVRRGQVIGRCGHTGHSTEPHLHFHLQDSADVFQGMGLPVSFTALLVDGKEASCVYLAAGNRVRHAPSLAPRVVLDESQEARSGADEISTGDGV